jgi:ATP-dependent Clp protease ATP-binding subunit ClpA
MKVNNELYTHNKSIIRAINEVYLNQKSIFNSIMYLYKKLNITIGDIVEDKELKIELSPEAQDYIIEAGYDPVYGARPLKRLLKTQLENKLALKILDGEITDNDTADVIVSNGALDVVKRKHA